MNTDKESEKIVKHNIVSTTKIELKMADFTSLVDFSYFLEN